MRAFTAFVVLLLSSGCATGIGALYFAELTAYSRDVSDRPEFWGGYVQGAVLETVAGTFVKELTQVAGSADLFVNQPGDLGQPASVEEYRANPAKWPLIKAVLPPRTRLRVELVEEYASPGFRRQTASVHILAKVMEGEFAGSIVNIDRLSRPTGKEHKHAALYEPDPEILKVVSDPIRSKG